MNDVRKIETVMTYDQWKEEYRKRIKQFIKHKLERFLCWIVIGCLFFSFPVLMIMHYIIVGY